MATHEHNGTLSYKDENGDIHKIYPKTKAGNVDGLYNSPAMTGVPTAPTAEAGTNTEQLATTAFVQNAVENVTVPTTDRIIKDSTDALTSGGMYKFWRPSDGCDIMVNDFETTFRRSRAFIQINDPLIGDGKSHTKIESDDITLVSDLVNSDSTVSYGLRGTSIEISKSALTLKGTGYNSKIGNSSIQLYHGFLGNTELSDTSVNSSQTALYATTFAPSFDSKIYLGSPGGRWESVCLKTSPSVVSDRNQKKDIEYFEPEYADNIISKLKPCNYRFKDGTSGRIHSGLIAQDVEEALSDLGIGTNDFAAFMKANKVEMDESGNVTPIEGEYEYSLRYEEFISLLISECQYLKSRIDDMESRLPVTK